MFCAREPKEAPGEPKYVLQEHPKTLQEARKTPVILSSELVEGNARVLFEASELPIPELKITLLSLLATRH